MYWSGSAAEKHLKKWLRMVEISACFEGLWFFVMFCSVFKDQRWIQLIPMTCVWLVLGNQTPLHIVSYRFPRDVLNPAHFKACVTKIPWDYIVDFMEIQWNTLEQNSHKPETANYRFPIGKPFRFDRCFRNPTVWDQLRYGTHAMYNLQLTLYKNAS